MAVRGGAGPGADEQPGRAGALRPAVLWRKQSLGSHSRAGCRFVERMLSVTATLRQRGRKVLDYLEAALSAHRLGQPPPGVFAAG